MTYPVDIVVPVWNRPVETRACLASLVDGSPRARVIMVNYGSERETERILEEFAEALDDRAMLVSTGRNVGRVAALNHGIAISSAPLVVILQDEVTVGSGWLDPLLEIVALNPDIGLAVPSRGEKNCFASYANATFHEVDHGSLAVMAMRRELYAAIGGLDEDMDGGIWCLRDYSRRAERAGFRTASVTPWRLVYGEPQQLGSAARREERIYMGGQTYRQRWGEQHHFCFVLVGTEAGTELRKLLPALLAAARQGNSVNILADKGNAGQFRSYSQYLLHDGICLETLPVFFNRRAMKKRLEQLTALFPDMITVIMNPTVEPCSSVTTLQEFMGMIDDCCRRYYTLKGGDDAVNG